MPLPLDVWIIHPDETVCEAFRERFVNLPRVRILSVRYEELPEHDCFVTAANAFGIMNAGIDAAVIRKHGETLMERIQHRILDEYLGEQPIGTCLIEPTGDAAEPYVGHAPTMRTPGNIEGTDHIYAATWAAFLAVYRFNTAPDRPTPAEGKTFPIESVVFPAMGTGFGGVSPSEAARQMAVAYQHYMEPPHRLNWDVVADRNRAIRYDGNTQVVR